MLLRKTDLSTDAINSGIWDSLLDLTGLSRTEHDNSDELELRISSAQINMTKEEWYRTHPKEPNLLP